MVRDLLVPAIVTLARLSWWALKQASKQTT